MRGLNKFLKFDWEAFANEKVFVATGVSEWKDFNTKEHLGTKVDAIIAVDKTIYPFKEGEQYSNQYQKINFKVNKDIKVPLNARVVPKGVKATVYGEYRNMLSVKCTDIVVVATSEKEKA